MADCVTAKHGGRGGDGSGGGGGSSGVLWWEGRQEERGRAVEGDLLDGCERQNIAVHIRGRLIYQSCF